MKKVLFTILTVAMIVAVCVACVACTGNDPIDKTTLDREISVGFQNGTTGQFYTEGYSNLTAKGYPNATLAVQDLISGRIDYVITDIAPAKSITSKMNGQVKVVDINLTEEAYCYAVDPSNATLLAQVNEFLKNNKAEIEALENAYIEGTNKENVIKSGDANAANALVVATSADFPPFENISGDGYVGIDLEIMKMFCDEYNYTLVINNMDFDSIVMNVQQGKSDIGAAALTWSEDRAKQVKFSDNYYAAAQVVIATSNDITFDNCKTKEDVEAILAVLGKKQSTSGTVSGEVA